jgi:hypothetical protein
MSGHVLAEGRSVGWMWTMHYFSGKEYYDNGLQNLVKRKDNKTLSDVFKNVQDGFHLTIWQKSVFSPGHPEGGG